MNQHFMGGRPQNRLEAAIKWLLENGYRVVPENIPGLFRINGGVELTEMQVISFASQHGFTG